MSENNVLKMTIHKIKSIQHAVLEFPVENGIHAIIGNNGTGKSTIIYTMAQLMNSKSLISFGVDVRDGDSYVEFDYKGINNRWEILEDKKEKGKVYMPIPENQIRINGMYEGSLFFGFRFKNYDKVNELLSKSLITDNILTDADDYIIEQLGYVLHGDKTYYKTSKIVRIINRQTVKKMGLSETPYFMITENGNLVSQYSMSSGESLMLSLLHFIYNSIIRRSLDIKQPALMLIDEIEVALHPIAVSRLLDLLSELALERSNLTVYVTSHSPEVIRKIRPRNLYKIEPEICEGICTLNVVNPCYASYAIRDVFRHDGYDWLVLVEDELAKIVVENVIGQLKLSDSKLIHVTPAGGWNNVLALQYDLFKHNVLGVGKNIISILDGDIKEECNSHTLYKQMPKRFLPISCIEKYLKSVLIDQKNTNIYKRINDSLFQLTSLNEVISDYKNKLSPHEEDRNGKIFYRKLLSAVQERNVSEEQFVHLISDIIMEEVDFTDFNKEMKNLLS
ncbi:MAG: ATP-binding protein [Lachnospiraceae bacterium]|nr:ATP-binding protein [Lachnospiraceae bacterium]